ncbi:MAG: hypothetical protein ACLGIF_03370, partial [Actinomycetes bacterium]
PWAGLVGTSLVETGVVDVDHYLAGVAALIRQHRVTRYFAHRKEAPDKLARVAALGLEVLRPHLPLEIVARVGPVGRTVISFPSTVAHTLPLVLADAGVAVAVCDLADDWFTATASPRSEPFLSDVARTARTSHHLAAVVA